MKNSTYGKIGGALWGFFVVLSFPTDWSILSLIRIVIGSTLGILAINYIARSQLADCKSEDKPDAASKLGLPQ